MSPNKCIREIKRLGWSVEKTPGGHLKLTRPEAAYPVFTASTTASQRAWLTVIETGGAPSQVVVVRRPMSPQ